MKIPVIDNEGKCCDAVLRVFERRTATSRGDLHVDPGGGAGDGHVDVCVGLGERRYVLEHTRVEPFPDAIATGAFLSTFFAPIWERLSACLPGPALYDLVLPQDPRFPKEWLDRLPTLRDSIVDWIVAEAPSLYAQASKAPRHPRGSAICGPPDMLPYPVRLQCHIMNGSPVPMAVKLVQFAPSTKRC